MTDTRVDDIALFFSRAGETLKRWVSHDVYTDENYKLDSIPQYWAGAVFLQERSAGFYVTNLSNLNNPGAPPESFKRDPFRKALPAFPAPNGRYQPQPGDLVVIPWDQPNTAYAVPQARYENPEQCPPISDSSGADLRFMALTEGVVLANVPKTDPQGMTCYLLNLMALKPSGTFPGRGEAERTSQPESHAAAPNRER